jgi:hypothetical protein
MECHGDIDDAIRIFTADRRAPADRLIPSNILFLAALGKINEMIIQSLDAPYRAGERAMRARLVARRAARNAQLSDQLAALAIESHELEAAFEDTGAQDSESQAPRSTAIEPATGAGSQPSADASAQTLPKGSDGCQ